MKKLLEAGKTSDVDAAKGVLCQGDIAGGLLTELQRNGKVKTYSIDNVRKVDSTDAVVRATVATEQGRPRRRQLPRGQGRQELEGLLHLGRQRAGRPVQCVCFRLGVLPGELPSISIPSISVPSISIPSISVPSIGGFSNACGFATTARSAAITYVGLAEMGQTDFAQGCVYKSRWPSRSRRA